MTSHILILDTPDGDLKTLTRTFEEACGEEAIIQVVQQAAKLYGRLEAGPVYDLVVFDYVLGDGTTGGDAILQKIRQCDRVVPVVAVAEHGDVESADKVIQAGATDFLVRGGALQ